MTTRFPPKENFNQFPEQVVEFFRSLSDAAQRQEDLDISSAIGRLNALIEELGARVDEIEASQNQSQITFEEQINNLSEVLESLLRTNVEQRDRIQNIEDEISTLPNHSELNAIRSMPRLEVLTYEYSGTFASPDLTTDVNITEIRGQGECFIEISTNQPISGSVEVTSEILNATTIRLTRGSGTDSVQYVLKVKDYRNG